MFSADRRSGSGGLVKPASRAAMSNFSYRRHAVDIAAGGFDLSSLVAHVRFGFVSLRPVVSFTFFVRLEVALNGMRPFLDDATTACAVYVARRLINSGAASRGILAA